MPNRRMEAMDMAADGWETMPKNTSGSSAMQELLEAPISRFHNNSTPVANAMGIQVSHATRALNMIIRMIPYGRFTEEEERLLKLRQAIIIAKNDVSGRPNLIPNVGKKTAPVVERLFRMVP